ncbi:MAG: AAA family ATPase [Nitrososphaerota archaeon]|nr:AAA family ATPase [Nitrososphaerota archaeon]
MGKIIAVTGTPGTGKKSVAPLLAEELGLTHLALNDLVPGRGHRRSETLEVDTKRLRRTLLARAQGRTVVSGHLVPDVLLRRDVERVIVLRCRPDVLKDRLSGRGYPRRKVFENVEAELIGVIRWNAVARFGKDKVIDLDTTGLTARRAALKAEAMISRRPGTPAATDWLGRYASAAKLRSLLSE